MKKEDIRSTCGSFIMGEIDNPCCSTCPACNCHKTKENKTKDIEEIVNEFQKQFGFEAKAGYVPEIAEFLRQALLSHTKAVEERLRGKIEKMRDFIVAGDWNERECRAYREGFHQALSDILKLLE